MSRRKQSRPFKVQDDDDDDTDSNTNNGVSKQLPHLANGHDHHTANIQQDSQSEKSSIDDLHIENEIPVNRIKRTRLSSDQRAEEGNVENIKNTNKATENCSSDTRATTNPLTATGAKILHQCQDSANNNDNNLENDSAGSREQQSLPQEHVTLEALENTKVAVAQFAATALAKGADETAIKDLALLQSTLFTLQHQQVFQLQLIEKLQSQLKTTKSIKDTKQVKPNPDGKKKKKDSVSSASLISSSAQPNSDETKLSVQLFDGKCEKIETPSSSVDKNSPTIDIIQSQTKIKVPELHSKHDYHISSSLASSIITNHDTNIPPSETNSLQMLQKRTEEVLDSASQSFSTGNLIDELSYRTGACFDDVGNGIANDPSLKHRCRFCGKIFGSDSALQIHLRSHTGERPFKCNLCPSSFTTKGNLKVHYQRHTETGLPFNPVQNANFPSGNTFLTKTEQKYGVELQLSSKHENSPNSKNLSVENPLPENGATDLSQPKKPETNLQNNRSTKSYHAVESSIRSQTHQNESSSLNPNSLRMEQPQLDFAKNDFRNGRKAITPISFSSSSSSKKKAWESFMEITNTPKASQLQNDEQNRIDPNKCPLCHRVLSCRSALRQHYRTHTGERPFRCRICTRSFTTKGNLKTHISIHKLNPFLNPSHNCSICHKKYSNARALQQHINTHTGEPIEMTIDQIRAAEVCDYTSKERFNESYGSGSSLSLGDYNDHENSLELDLRRKSIETPNDQIKESPVAHLSDSDDQEIRIKSNPRDFDKIDSGSNQLKHLAKSPEFDFYHQPIDPVNLSKTSMQHQASVSASSSTSRIEFLSTFPPMFGGGPVSLPTSHVFGTSFNPMLATSPFNRLGFSPGVLNAATANCELMLEQCTAYPNIKSPIMDFVPGIRGNTTCNICFKTFACHSALEIHYRSHTKERPYKCSICNRGFSTKGNMKQHMLTHKIRDMPQHVFGNSQHPAQSPSSDSGSSFPSTGFQQQRKSPSETSHEFDEKPNSDHLPQRLNTMTPEKNHLGGNVLVADQRESYSSADDDPVSMASPTESAIAKELNCSKENGTEFDAINDHESHSNRSPNYDNTDVMRKQPSSPSRSNLGVDDDIAFNRNEQKTPESPPISTPPILNAIKSSENDDAHASTNPKHLCTVCNKYLSSSSSVQIHMRTHTGAKPFCCNVCQKSFSTKGNLKVHMGTHMWTNGASRRGRRMSLEIANSFSSSSPYNFHRSAELFNPFMANAVSLQQKFHEANLFQKYSHASNIRDFLPTMPKKGNKPLPSSRGFHDATLQYSFQAYGSGSSSKYDKREGGHEKR